MAERKILYEKKRLAEFYQSAEEQLHTVLKQARLNSDHHSAIGEPIETFVERLLDRGSNTKRM